LTSSTFTFTKNQSAEIDGQQNSKNTQWYFNTVLYNGATLNIIVSFLSLFYFVLFFDLLRRYGNSKMLPTTLLQTPSSPSPRTPSNSHFTSLSGPSGIPPTLSESKCKRLLRPHPLPNRPSLHVLMRIFIRTRIRFGG
jgi:hypothetical protein